MGVDKDATVEFNAEKTTANITWPDGHISKCNVKWLRYHCHCDRCWRAFSGMHPLDKSKFPDDFFFQSANIEDGNITFSVDHEVFEDHVSKIPLDWLRSHCNCKACLEKEVVKREKSFAPGKIPRMNYKDIEDKQGLYNLLTEVLQYGFCVVHDVPNEEKICLKVGARIGPIFSSTFHEYYREEASSGTAEEDSSKLPLHQDMAFYEVTPGVQLLHVRRLDNNKQETVVADFLDVAETLRKESPTDFESLVRIPGTFELKEEVCGTPVWYEMQKPHIEVDYFGKIAAVHWHPQLEGPLKVHESDVAAYCKAHKAFSEILNRKEKQIKLKLKPGDLFILNNHRMAHDHDGYFNGPGDFCSELCYANIDDLKSTCIVLAHNLGLDFTPIKVGNRSSF